MLKTFNKALNKPATKPYSFDIPQGVQFVVTEPRYALPRPLTLRMPDGFSEELEIKDANSGGVYFTMKTRYATLNCLRYLFDVTGKGVAFIEPQDGKSKQYKIFYGDNRKSRVLCEAELESVRFDQLSAKVKATTVDGEDYEILIEGNYRDRQAIISHIPNKIQRERIGPGYPQAIPIARQRPGHSLVPGNNPYYLDIAEGVDNVLIAALCAGLDGKLLAISRGYRNRGGETVITEYSM